jgi:hypothetical protein
MGSCPISPLSHEIDIGDYEGQLDAWNKQNLLDYKLTVECYALQHTDEHRTDRAVITVRNGIPESCYPPEWLESGEMSTVTEAFSFIKEEEKRIKKSTTLGMLVVRYDTEYHYPMAIRDLIERDMSNVHSQIWIWHITLTPLAE